MSLTEERRALLAEIKSEWDRAEEDIKTAEQVTRNIVIPAIKELRYAGRRLADALFFMLTDEDSDEVRKLLDDARFNCHRARHDAIDAATSAIAAELQICMAHLGEDAVLRAYPSFPDLLSEVDGLRERIAESRRERENRERIYTVLEGQDFPELVKQFRAFKRCRPIMEGLARRTRLHLLLGYAFGVGGILVAMLGIFVSMLIAN